MSVTMRNETQPIIKNAEYVHDRKIRVTFDSGEMFVLDMQKVSTVGYYPNYPPSLTEMDKFNKVEVSHHRGHIGWPEGYVRGAEGRLLPIYFDANELFFWGSHFSEDIPFDPTVVDFLETFAIGRKLTQETLDHLKADHAPETFVMQLSRLLNEVHPRPEYFLGRIGWQTQSSKRANYMELLEKHLEYVDNFKGVTFLFAHSTQLPSNFYEEVIYVLFRRDGVLYEVCGDIIDSCDPVFTNVWNPVETARQSLLEGIEARTIGWIEGRDIFASELLKIVNGL
ncbi:MAG: hypothetical protein K9N10_12905 [Deltaproteobacteria bacterium]|nr:hypothetical protein [Deltaproteobacteria bacterium]